ncbi:MAG TPA: hypothetical protein VF519_09990 [Mycobacteriales bacterium]|jgi:hypothetical protein
MDLRRNGLPMLSAGRAAVGVAMLARPTMLPKSVGVDSTTAARLTWLTRMFGARELALGAGTLLALRRGRDVEEWALAQLLSDAVDAAAFAGAVAHGDVRRVQGGAVALMAVAGVATGVGALRELRTARA